MIYDVCIIGGGSAGAHCAYYLKKNNLKVLVVDKSLICKAATYAAGAFISYRFGMGGFLQKETNKAVDFSIDFYEKNFSSYLHKAGLLRLPKDMEEGKKIKDFLPFLKPFGEFRDLRDETFLKPYSKEFGGVFFKNASIVEAYKVCIKLLEGIKTVENYEVKEIKRKKGFFEIGDFKSKYVVIATGAWDELVPQYIQINKVAGIRFDCWAKNMLKYSIHKKISISSAVNGKFIVGATHNRVENISNLSNTPVDLIKEMKKMVIFKDFKILQMFCGVRASVYDHLPVIGEIIDMEKTLAKFPLLKHGKKIDKKEFIRDEGIYIINGLGGRGFVFGALAAKYLTDYILNKKEIPSAYGIERIFVNFIRKKLK